MFLEERGGVGCSDAEGAGLTLMASMVTFPPTFMWPWHLSDALWKDGCEYESNFPLFIFC